MDRMIYVAMSGARQIMHKQATNNHNLANLNTNGFKAEIDAFKALPVYGPGHPSRVYGEDFRVGTDHSAGSLTQTGNPLDVGIEGDGFIAVQDVDGAEAYTRAGALQISATGVLQTTTGFPVLGNGGPITLTPFESMDIGADGTITIRPLGQAAGELAVLDRIKLVNPDSAALKRNERGLFVGIDGPLEAGPDAAVKLAPGALETSNVNPVDALVTMIELARQYETQVKLMKSAEENDQAADKLLSIR